MVSNVQQVLVGVVRWIRVIHNLRCTPSFDTLQERIQQRQAKVIEGNAHSASTQPEPSIPSARTKERYHSQVGKNDHLQKVSTEGSEANSRDRCRLCKFLQSFLYKNSFSTCQSVARNFRDYRDQHPSTSAQLVPLDSTTQRSLPLETRPWIWPP